MKSYNKDIGSYTENIAATYLLSNGYSILDRNYRNKFGEVDIICQKDNLIIFVEIKSRYTNSFGSPLESVSCHKQNKIILLSKYYILYKKLSDFNIRYDVIEIYLNHLNNTYEVNHLEDAFRCY